MLFWDLSSQENSWEELTISVEMHEKFFRPSLILGANDYIFFQKSDFDFIICHEETKEDYGFCLLGITLNKRLERIEL